MNTVDRVLPTGERQILWQCSFCFDRGQWLTMGPTEQDRRRANQRIEVCYEAHRCAGRTLYERRHYRRSL